MRFILTNIPLFILAMMGGFLILLVLAAMDGFDVWTRRYTHDRRGSKISPDKLNNLQAHINETRLPQ